MRMRGPKKPACCDGCGEQFAHKAPRWLEDKKQYHRPCAPKFKMACTVINQIVAQRRHA